MKKSKTYKNILKKLITIKQPPKPRGLACKILLPDIKDTYKDNLKEWHSNTSLDISIEKIKKMGALLEHYKIDKSNPERWFFLSLALANEHVTGFQVVQESSMGAPIKWNDRMYGLLYLSVIDKIYSKKGSAPSSVSWACDQLIKEPPWKDIKSSEAKAGYITAKTLKNRYKKSRQLAIPVFYIAATKDNHTSQNAVDLRKTLVEALKASQ